MVIHSCLTIIFLRTHMTFADVPISARNILENPELKDAVKAFR